jgi:CBS domain containing-hemolysin-like protein
MNDKPPTADASRPAQKSDIKSWIKSFLTRKEEQDDDLREALEEYIEELSSADGEETQSAEERILITNILNLRDMTVVDVMIPRADIVAIDVETPPLELLTLLSEKQFSRIPVYKGTMDEILGTVHVKDVLACLAQNKPLIIPELLRDALIVSPALPVINLILLMKEKKKHLAFVVDEYGGIDGLVTIGDLIECIIGKIHDEHEADSVYDAATIIEKDDGYVADGRLDIEDFEKLFGNVVPEDMRDEIDTLAGFLFSLASRVPGRGEIISHDESGLSFEILDADPRRVGKVRIRKSEPSDPHQLSQG